MCGLFGEFGHSLLNKDQFITLNALSRNRGPDMSGYWTDNYYCQLGFNRLSILDLSKNGNQPMKIIYWQYYIYIINIKICHITR